MARSGIPVRYRDATLSDFPGFSYVPGQSYYLCGAPGAGKTHLMCALVRELAPWKRCLRIPMIEMLNNVRDSYDQKSPERDDYDDDDPSGNIVNRMCNMHILALDDIGREKSTEWTQEMFYLIVNRRYEDMAITHFASNFSLGELADVVDARIARRIGEMCRVVNLNKRVSDG